MLIAHITRLARALVRRLARRRSGAASHARRAPSGLAALDRRMLADIGIGPGEILSVPRRLESLRRPPHL
jgi:uncharacterized protein YjiS (DUF1127 family)